MTERPGHATDLARTGARDDVDVVAVLGGDGTVNEAVNGLIGTDVPLAILPGGGADVFARSVGIPKDPSDAAELLGANFGGTEKARRVPLGHVVSGGAPERHTHRFFVANCGIGFDAAIVRSVESKPDVKRRVGDWYFVWVGLRLFFAPGFDRRTPHVELAWGEGPDERKERLFLAIVQNTTPYTFLGGRALRLCPDARLDGGLDCFAVDTMRTGTVVPLVLSAFGSARRVGGRHVTYLRDRTQFRIQSDRALPAQVDGEYIGEHTDLIVESLPDALSVVC